MLVTHRSRCASGRPPANARSEKSPARPCRPADRPTCFWSGKPFPTMARSGNRPRSSRTTRSPRSSIFRSKDEITRPRTVSPPEFVFDKVAVGESKSAEVFVMAMLQDELVVSDPKISDPTTSDKFDVKIEPVDDAELPNPEAKQGVRVTLTTKPGLPIGRFHQWLSLRTNLPDSETLDIPLIGRVVGDISVHGIDWNEEAGVLSLGKVKSSEGREQRVNVVARGEDAPDVQLAVDSVDPPELKVTFGEPKKLKDTLVHFPVEIRSAGRHAADGAARHCPGRRRAHRAENDSPHD